MSSVGFYNMKQLAEIFPVGRNKNGTQKRKYFYGKTGAEVADKLAQAIKDKKLGLQLDLSKVPTVSEWLQIWLWNYVESKVKPTTLEQYEVLVRKHIEPQIGKIKLTELKADQIQRLYNKMREDGFSVRTIQLAHSVLHAALKQAIRCGHLITNVSEALFFPKTSKKRCGF